MKILFAWTGVTSYMADCWRSLRQAAGVELRIVVELADSGKAFAAEKTLAGLDCVCVEKNGPEDSWKKVLRGGWRPDVVFAGGWRSPTTRNVVSLFSDVPKVFCLDMPWRWLPRCIAARFVLRGFMHKFAAVFVPGALSAKYARWLGFPDDSIFRRLYAVDQAKFRRAVAANGDGCRSGFLFVGRFSPEKRVDLVEAAYARYRALGGTWGIDYYGQGGKFAQADEMPGVYASHACLLLASSFDPWPLVMLEAKSASMDVVASSRCGNCVELGARTVRYGDVEAMARAMLSVEHEWRGGCAPASDIGAYDCAAWATRVLEICDFVRRGRFYCPGMDDPANGMAVVARLMAEDDRHACGYIVHGAWLPAVWSRCFWALLRGTGYVRMCHGAYSPVYLRGHGRWKKILAGPLERFFLRRAERIIVTCKEEKEWVEQYLGGGNPPIEIADIKRFFNIGQASLERPAGHGGRPLHLLYLGRRHPLKGVAYLEEAVRQLNDGFQKGNDGKLSPLDLKVASDATGDEKERVWNWCDVLVLPSLSENFGLVVAEALERGKRVITTDGAPAWRGQNGVVYLEGFRDGSDDRRVELLRGAIESLISRR